MEERRKHIRVSTPVIVMFPHPASMKTERSFTQDISESGMRFPTAVELRIGQEVPLTIGLPFGDGDLHLTGEVLWVREISRHGPVQYDVGVRFRWVEDPDRQQLNRHLTSLLQRRV